jgi:hypothetical protein
MQKRATINLEGQSKGLVRSAAADLSARVRRKCVDEGFRTLKCGRRDGMKYIHLQSATGRNVPNEQETEISAYDSNYSAALPSKFLEAQFLTTARPRYNCHGLTFASRRTTVKDGSMLRLILEDDGFSSIDRKATKCGDIILYVKDGEVTHSGIVVANEPPLHVPMVWSKWGKGPEVVHRYFDTHAVYGSDYEFYSCR